jgi:uncharacterized protein (DUF305 family)
MRSITALTLALLIAVATAPGTPVSAQEKGSGSGSGSGKGSEAGAAAGTTAKSKASKGSGSGAHAGPKGDQGPASQAYDKANIEMHKGMDITFTGDADVDFARGMIPHHNGAVDMAKIVLKYGKDPALRKLAEEIVKAQETEIAFMKDWLKNKGK